MKVESRVTVGLMAVCLFAVIGTASAQPRTPSPVELIYVDTHNHLVGRVSGGLTRRFDYSGPAETALATMDAAGVKINLVMPMPQDDEQENRLYLDDILPVVKKYPGRFAVLGGGGSLNVMIQEAIKSGTVTESLKKKFDDTAAELIRKGVVGFGEMTAEHFSMKAGHHYESSPPNHPLFLRLADLAAKYDVPMDMHMEAIPEETPLPSRLKSPPNPRILKPNIAEFEQLLAHNREAKIIWVHLGWDSTGKRTVDLTRKLLLRHSNLYLSIRVAGGMQARNVVRETFPLDGRGNLKPDWLALFQEFPDRFLIGSDEIIQRGNRHPSAGSIRATVGMLRQLPQELQRKIGYENAYRLYKLQQ
ncbi:MAG: amidohydrolase family protein [bacterium]|nr:amidohydrolase family protein [bacterium]